MGASSTKNANSNSAHPTAPNKRLSNTQSLSDSADIRKREDANHRK